MRQKGGPNKQQNTRKTMLTERTDRAWFGCFLYTTSCVETERVYSYNLGAQTGHWKQKALYYNKCVYRTVVFLHDDRSHVDDKNVVAFFHPDVTPTQQVLESLVTVVLPLRYEIFDSCERRY